MNIRPKIPKFSGGNNLWYSRLTDYNPIGYKPTYNPNYFFAGDTINGLLNPWKSNLLGFDKGRYLPTSGYGDFGKGNAHYNYTLGVEKQDYYKQFGDALLDSNGKFTPIGEAWAKAVDELLPPGSKASFYDEKGQIRNFWTTEHGDIHGRPARTFNDLRSYVDYVRKDLILGARHNVFGQTGRRYFYKDLNGLEHWVDPEVIGDYIVSDSPVREVLNGPIMWEDYELTGLKSLNTPPSLTPKYQINFGLTLNYDPTFLNPSGNLFYRDPSHLLSIKKPEDTQVGKVTTDVTSRTTTDDQKSKSSNFKANFSKILPDLLGAGRLIGNLWNNERVFGEQIKGIRPDLRQTYNTYRQVVGDEATKQAYYRRGIEGVTRASQPFTSDADKQMAYLMETLRQANELKAQGDLIDNLRIRETSELSSQHADANTQRATEIANANIASINAANKLKHDLLAMKHATNWTSIDNYLLTKEGRLRDKQRKRDLILYQIDSMDESLKLSEDLYPLEIEYDQAVKERDAAIAEGDMAKATVLSSKISEIASKVRNKRYEQQKLLLYKQLLLKSGNKITYKKKEDLLYKTTKDNADHLVKMIKLTSDSNKRPRIKIEKLTSHPKGKTKRYQQGGVAPFTVWRPATTGGETTISSETSTTTKSSSNKGDDTLDLIKNLFKEVSGSGLPSDINTVYTSMRNFLAKSKIFGDSMTTDDIAGIYLSLMERLNKVKYYKENFDKARDHAILNDAMSEFAVDINGNILVLTLDGKIRKVRVDDFLEDLSLGNPLTNEQLLNIRAIDPNLAFSTLFEGIVSNSVGMTKIIDEIQKLISNIGTTEISNEGYTKSQAGNIKAGFELLLHDAPDGIYKYKELNKTLSDLIELALKYIDGILPKNYKAVLKLNAGLSGTTVSNLLISLLGSRINITQVREVDAVTEKGNKNSTTGKSSSGTDTPASVLFLLGNGYQQIIEFNIGTSLSVKALGRFGILLDTNKNNLGLGSTLQDVSSSQFGPILDLDEATFGGSRLNTSGYSHVILSNSDCVGVDLPVKTDNSGNYVPDFLQLNIVEKAEEYIANNNITNPQLINNVYRNFNLPDKFDSSGNLITLNYKRFAAIKATLDSKALKGGTPINMDEVQEADDSERELFIESMKKLGNKDYDLNNGILWSDWGKDKLYKGTIFVPVRDDIVGGYISGGLPLDTDLPNNANQVAMMLHAPKTQEYQKAPPLSSLK